MREKLRRFMYGRYGNDDLNRALSIAAIGVYIISIILRLQIIYLVGYALIIWCIFRMFSKNIDSRRRENMAFWRYKQKFLGFFRARKTHLSQRKTHRFYRCPNCRQKLRVPRGRGRLSINCPKCHTVFEKKT